MGRLIFVGLGLRPTDLTQAAREAIDSADEVVAEFYTSKLVGMDPKQIAQWLERPVRFLRRMNVEEEGEALIEAAKVGVVCFLTGGDAMTATTHNDLRFRAQKAGVETEIIHGVSIVTAAAGQVGLQAYKFGRITTLVMPHGDYLPKSPFDVILNNRRQGLHSLVLLDLDTETERFMLVPDAAKQLVTFARTWNDPAITPETLAVGCARVGNPDQQIMAAPLVELGAADLGDPLHCLIIPGELHFTEEDAIAYWKQKTY